MNEELTIRESRRKVVLGLGNLLYHDEGFGIHALKALQDQLILSEKVELVDGGILGMNLLPLIEECSHLLVLDALDAGLPPGTLVELQGEQIPLFTGVRLSEHQVSFQDVLGIAHFLGAIPAHFSLLGIQPKDLTLGVELSSTVSKALPGVVQRVIQIVDAWSLPLSN